MCINLPEDHGFINLNIEKRERFIEAFIDLEKDIIESDLSSEAKELSIEKIHEICFVIDKQFLFDPKDVKRVSDAAFSSLVFTDPRISDDDKKKSTFWKVVSCIGTFSIVVLGVAHKIEPALSSVEITGNYIFPKVREVFENTFNPIQPFVNTEGLEKGIKMLCSA